MTLKTLTPHEPKVCHSCKVDLFKSHYVKDGYVCGLCGQQYLVRVKNEENK